MSYVKSVLLPDERVLYMAEIHWVIYLQGLVITVVGGLLSTFSWDIMVYAFGVSFARLAHHIVAGITAFIVIAGVALLAGAYIRQTSTELALTNKRIIAKYGFISRTTFEIMLSRITGSNFDQTVIGRMLNFGTILVHGAGGEISPIDNVDDPQRFHLALMQVLEDSRTGRI